MSILSDTIKSAENLYTTIKDSRGIKLWVHPIDKPVYDLTNLVEKVTWSGDYKSPSRTLEFSVFSSAVDINTQSLDLPVGSTVCFYHNNTELFRGMVIDRSRNSGNNSINYTCKDIGSRLVRSRYAYNFTDEKPEDIANKILKENGFTVGEVLKIDFKYTKIFTQSTIYDIIMSAYTSATTITNKKYMITTDIDKINVVEKGKTKLKVAFNEDDNLINTSFSESIDNVVNKVILIDQSGNKINELQDNESIKRYGVLQDIVQQQQDGGTNTDLKSYLQDVKKTCNLKGFGDTSCITGYGVEVKDSYTGLVGLFYIDSDKHTWTPGDYSIDLELNFQNIMDEHNDGQDPQVESGDVGGDGVMIGTEYNAEITAYYPSNDPMQGGFKDAQGNKLDPSKNTCAAPKGIAFGKKVQVKGTGTDKDGQVYTVTDRGGAIVVDKNGVYHIDLLMKDRKTAYAFGRRNGKIIVGDGQMSYPSDGGGYTSSGNAAVEKAVSFCKSKLGTPYLWGGTGPRYDCSGLTMKAYESAGIKIPRNSRAQAKAGSYVERKNLRRGDLVFFGDNNYITHVGMYLGSNEFIHSPSTGDKVKISTLTGSYRRRYITARRFA